MKFLDYIRGIRKGKDAHRIEHNAMNDPFLADAIEGYDSVEGDHADKIAQMQARISARTSAHKKRVGAWKSAVAAVVVIALLGGYFTLMNHRSSMMVAQEQDSSYINLYIPETYVENKGVELAENSSKTKATAVVNITNLAEVIKPIGAIKIYIPGNYAQLKDDELKELSTARERRSVPVQSAAGVQAEEPVMMAEVVSPSAPAAVILESQNTIDTAGAPENVDVMPDTPALAMKRAKPSRYSIAGKVVDRYNEPLIGVAVSVKGTDKAVITDIDGNYRVESDSESPTLIARYLGYETIELPEAKNNEVIAMKESQSMLEESVVIGYGKKKKIKEKGIEPKPLIGHKAYERYLKDNLVRPIDSDCEGKKGKVVLTFYVDDDGRPVDVMVKEGLCDAYDEEAIRLVESGPAWTTGTTKVTLKVKF